MSLNISDENMNAIIAKAVLDSITPETRETLITESIKNLLESSESNFGHVGRRTRLQAAFDSAMIDVAKEIAHEEISKNDKAKAKISELMSEAWENMINSPGYNKIVDNMSYTLTRVLAGER